MKLEEGMYVRTEEGEISKIKWITVQRWEGLDNTIEANFILPDKCWKTNIDNVSKNDYLMKAINQMCKELGWLDE